MARLLLVALLALLPAGLAGCGGGGGSGGGANPLIDIGSGERRTIDGTENSPDHPEWGAADTQLLRIAAPAYGDGVSSPAGAERPSARLISSTGCVQAKSVLNTHEATDFLWQWGQFIDHDIDLTESGDPFFDPEGTGVAVIALDRSLYDPFSGTGPDNPRQQVNEITSFIDASNIYGSDPVRAAALRANDGIGRLKTSEGNLLPFNTDGLPNAGGSGPDLFLGGDVRANEQVGLTAMHTLFMREHNRLAGLIRESEPDLDGDEIYERARAIVGAEEQVITYREFLPVLLGPDALAPYAGYRPEVNAGIDNVFSTACYRVGHTLLSPILRRLGDDGATIPQGNLALRDAFFAPSHIVDEGGIDPLLRGLASQEAQEIDMLVVDDVRNFLFGEPGAGGFDLASLNIQRGRDHGLPDYNSVRVAYGLPPAASFADVTSTPGIQEKLATLYGSVDDIDVWIGGLAEDHVPGAMVGELVFTVLKNQFERLRDGDRFWYQNAFSDRTIAALEDVTLADVIRDNTEIGTEIQDAVFSRR
jgi:peroxidase